MLTISRTKLKYLKSLSRKKGRIQEGKFIIEGYKLLEECLREEIVPEIIVTIEENQDLIPESAIRHSVEILHCPEQEFKKLSSQESPEGVLAVVRSEALPAENKGDGGFLLDRVQDPGNLGTILRIADWFGMGNVYCSKGSVDHLNDKALRSSMGSVFRIPVIKVDDVSGFLEKYPRDIWLSEMKGNSVESLPFGKNDLFVLGNEAGGISDEILNRWKERHISIPGSGSAESLNVAMAATVIAWEIFRKNH